MPNQDWNPELTKREFRVKKVARYIVTDWSDYRGGGSVTEVCGPSTLEQANAIAAVLGSLHPGALVNPMEPEPDSYGLPLTLDDLLKALPYEYAAAMRRGALRPPNTMQIAGALEVVAALDRLQIAVDACRP